MPADTCDAELPRGMLHGVPFETYRDALLAWRNAGDEEYAYARKFAFLPEGRERELGRELWLKHAEISDACYAEVVRLKPPPPPLAPPFCKCCQCGHVPSRHYHSVMITLSIFAQGRIGTNQENKSFGSLGPNGLAQEQPVAAAKLTKRSRCWSLLQVSHWTDCQKLVIAACVHVSP